MLRRLAGALAGILTMTVVAAATFALLRRLQPAPGPWWRDTTHLDRGRAASGRRAPRPPDTRCAGWRTGSRPSGVVTELLLDLSDADDLGPLLACGALFTLDPPAGLRWAAHPAILWAGQIGLGVSIGLLTALLVSREFRSRSLWGLLFGTSMVAIGLAVRADLAVLTVGFCMGLGLSAVSRHRQAIRAVVLPAEFPLRLPALHAGRRAHRHRRTCRSSAWLIPVVLAARLVAKALVAGCGALVSPPLRRTGPALIPGLMACGPTSMCIGLAFALRFPGSVGETVLVSAAAATVLGEVLSPLGLRTALRRAGEAPAQTGSEPVVEVAA